MAEYPTRRQHLLHGFFEDDRIRLGDTSLRLRVESNLIEPGEEGNAGAGRNMRDALATRPVGDDRTSVLDAVVKQVTLVDPLAGVVKCDIGIKDGRVVGLGQAGNPDMQSGVDLVVDTQTMIIPGWGYLATPGAIDNHVHFLNAAQLDTYGELGYTTLIGGSPGPVADVGVNPRDNVELMLDGLSSWPVNTAFLGRASSALGALEQELEAGCSGFKVHEDFGAFPTVIDAALRVSDDFDVQTMIHTDSINESVTFEETLDAIAGRTIHATHVEGAGGGHVPDILECVSEPNILPSSTNPTNPYSENNLKEHLDMILTCHLGHRSVVEDVAAAQSRVRPSTMAAEDLLHDLGAISMMGADSNGMGRAGESVRRTWQLADKMKLLEGQLTDDDNDRVLRYLAKYTICPAVTHGISDHVGAIRSGALADIVLWQPRFFGVKPDVVIKSGYVSYFSAGVGNGSTLFVEPNRLRRQFAANGRGAARVRRIFTAEAALDSVAGGGSHWRSSFLPVGGTRGLSKADLPRNTALPRVQVDRDTFDVRVDGNLAAVPPSISVPLNRAYFLH